MKSALRIAAPLAAMFVAAPVAAVAQNAIMTDDAALRAGPGFEYPRVAYVPEDARVRIHGCLRGYSWCDVSWRSDRGWVDASNLSYSWNNRYVVVENWGPRIGLPVIGFSVQDYWTRYYRDRPWWSQRHTWFERDGRWQDRDRRRDRDDGNQWRERRGDDAWRERDRRDDRNDWRDRQGMDRRGDDSSRRNLQQRELRGPGAASPQRDERVYRQQDERGGARAERNRGESGSTGRTPDRGPAGRQQEERM